MECHIIDVVTMAHHDLNFWWADGQFAKRPMAFTAESRDELGRLSACVVGVSGTGSIVAEQLARLGFGQIILVDFDRVEQKNLNRILNSTESDAGLNVLKVDSMRRAIDSYRGQTLPCLFLKISSRVRQSSRLVRPTFYSAASTLRKAGKS